MKKFFLIGSIAFCLFISIGGYWGFTKYKEKRILDESYQILKIVQTGPEKEALKTAYLAEILGLSIDHPTPIFSFDCKEGEKKLLASPLIQSAKIKKLAPSSLYIDYEVRKPLAILTDYKNIGIDSDGFLFPLAPFFSPKQIPEVYLGQPFFDGDWSHPIQSPYWDLALEVLHFLKDVPWKEGFCLKRLDVSNAFHGSLGQREIVLFTEETIKSWIFPKILRLAPKDYAMQLTNFFVLRKTMEEDYKRQLATLSKDAKINSRIIDLRIPQLAFVQTQE